MKSGNGEMEVMPERWLHRERGPSLCARWQWISR